MGAVASRNPDNARALTASLGLGRAVESYEAAVNDPGTDAVYIATPPDHHEAHALLAFAAGKPALIEKPLASNAEAAARITAAATAAGVFAMEAMWTRFQPLTRLIAGRIAAGELGALRGFHGSFLGANVPDPESSLFSRQSGGALLHRGVYPLSLAHHFLGPVRDVQARAVLGETGVDEEIVLTLTHESGALSDIRASLRVAGTNACTVWGTDARIEIAGPVWRPAGATLIRSQPVRITPPAPRRFEGFRESRMGQRIADWKSGLKRGARVRLQADFQGNGYGHEALHLMQAVAAGQRQSEIMPLDESVAILRIVDTALSQIGRGP